MLRQACCLALAFAQEIATSRAMAIPELLKPITKAFDNVLERRLLPIRSITAQVAPDTLPSCHAVLANLH